MTQIISNLNILSSCFGIKLIGINKSMSHMRKSYMQIPQLLDIPFFDNLKKATSAFNIEKLQPKLKLCHYSRGETVYSFPNQR